MSRPRAGGKSHDQIPEMQMAKGKGTKDAGSKAVLGSNKIIENGRAYAELIKGIVMIKNNWKAENCDDP